ncbi:Mitochondrial substrate carrier family protein B [Morus notabilis]|uniref:Mitochondrial substrate carrier family protein B n=1 Tax=Morus notabilis TaxID=981085 RepID=W9QFU9_9ROSA|nr:Mitochondrial substrate carrier family protein B [Morus notabilis]
MEARVGQRALNSAHGSVVDGGARKLFEPQPQQQQQQQQSQVKQSLNQQSHMGTVHFLAGGIAGAFSKTCTAPLARLTILFQVQGMHSDVAALSKASIWHEASRILNEEGFRAFWRGNLVTIAHRLPYSSVNFYAYERYKNLLHSILRENYKGNASTDLFVHFVGGGMAGITAASATYPLDLVRTRLAAQGVGPSIAISFSVYETLRSYWQSHRPNDSTVMVSLACGSLSGIASSTATFPLDLVRRRMQLEGACGRARVYNNGLSGAFRHIFKTEGLRGLYRGILPEYYKVVPGVGIVFMTYETLKIFLSSFQTSY